MTEDELQALRELAAQVRELVAELRAPKPRPRRKRGLRPPAVKVQLTQRERDEAIDMLETKGIA